jgi:hypothetical protein
VSGYRSRRNPADLIGAAIGLLLVLWSLFPAGVSAAAPQQQLLLTSTWSDTLAPVEQPWFDSFYDASRPLAIDNVLATGDAFAKQNLIATATDDPTSNIALDFIVSGTRMTDVEKAAAHEKGVDFLEIPLTATGLVFAVRAPATTVRAGWSTQKPCCKEVTEDGIEIPYDPEPYVGPIRTRPSVISRLYYGRLELAADSEFRADNSNELVPENGANGATQLVTRIDPGAVPKHVRSYLIATDAAVWKPVFEKVSPTSRFGDEEWPLLEKPTRSNQASLANALLSPSGPYGTPVLGGAVGPMTFGNFTPLLANPPTMDLVAAEIKNAADEWVAPNAVSIGKGIDAGIKTGATPLDTTFTEDAALTDATLKGAYPLSWVNWLIVPKTGLTADAANAIATLARYAVTTGQNDVKVAGEPALPKPLVDQAFALADVLVSSNCPASGYRTVETTAVGEFAPPGFALPNGVDVTTCEKVVAAASSTTTVAASTTSVTTTTVAPPTSTTPPAVPSTEDPGDAAPQATSRAVTRTAVPTTTSAAASPPSPDVTQPPNQSAASDETVNVAANALPYGSPSATKSPFDRMTTMFIGGSAMFVFLRRFSMRG